MAVPKILVVDDQPINVQLLKRKLEREGLSVIAAYTGIEAIDLVQREKPDLILLDVMMPDMDGIEVCQRLQAREDTRSIPIIFITARSTKESKLVRVTSAQTVGTEGMICLFKVLASFHLNRFEYLQ